MPRADAPSRPEDRLVVALDHPTADAALRQAEQLLGLCRWFKVGLELFTAAGPEVLRALRARGARIFLDLKLHDIPETAARAVRAAGALGVDLLTVHAAGGREMLSRAAAAGGPGLLGVTVLTSLDLQDLREVGVAADSIAGLTLLRARLCREAGLQGVVASPQEARALRAELGQSMLIVTPGVRPAGGQRGDQKRTATAAEALRAGADLIVVGRPLRDAANPRAAAEALLREMAEALQ